jgi:hypothetical protein
MTNVHDIFLAKHLQRKEKHNQLSSLVTGFVKKQLNFSQQTSVIKQNELNDDDAK